MADFNFITKQKQGLETDDFIPMYENEKGELYMIRFSDFIEAVKAEVAKEDYITTNN